MFKNLRSLKFTSRKKQEEPGKEHKKKNKTKPVKPTKPKGHALQKFKETMGNLTPSMFHGQHFVENTEEHATDVMSQLNNMRQNEKMCDVTITKSDGTKMKAHKIVVSFNEKLLEIVSKPPEETEELIKSDETFGISNEGFQNGKNGDLVPLVSDEEAEISRLKSVTSENDLVKGLSNDDVIREQVPASPEPKKSDEEKTTDENAKDNVTDDVTVDATNKNDGVTEENGEAKTEENAKETSEQNDVTAVDETSNDAVDKDQPNSEEAISLPLVKELKAPLCNGEVGSEIAETKVDTNETRIFVETKPEIVQSGARSDTCDVTIESDDVISPTSFEDPLEVLINFFYTSHINITQKNVIKLRIVARQCGMDDIIIACDEFEKVLITETENVASEEEKNEAALQFRYQYSDPQMAINMLEHFENLRSHSRHIDINVTSPTTSLKFPAHAALLVASCKFFADLLLPENDVIKTDVTTSDDVIKEVVGPDVKDAILQSLLMYFYTARVSLSQSNVRNLMHAADILQKRDVIEGCAEYLEGTISAQNCIEIQSTAEKYACEKLKKKTVRFIESNFLAVSRTNDFMTVTKEWISSIVSSQRIVTDFPASEGEYQIFEAVRKWVKHDLGNRKQDVSEAMANIRIPLIADQHLINDISTDLLIMEDDALCKRVSGIITGKSACKYDETVSMRGEEFILMIGGSAPVVDETSDEQGYTAVAFSDHVTLYDVKTGAMNELTNLPETRSLHCALLIDQYVIIAGGFDKYSCITNEVYCLDLGNLVWSKLPNMRVKRACFAMFFLNGYIYVAGGLTPTGYSNKVERYDRNKRKWEYVKPLPKTYYRHAGCIYHDEILISGGNEKSTDSLKYSPSGDEWRMMKPLNHGRDSHAMVTAMDKVFVIGGDIKVLSVEEYNSSSECWQLLPFMYTEPVYFSGCTVFEDKVYLIGGWRGDDDAHDDVRCFDAGNETWIPMLTRMFFPRGSMSATTVRMPKSYIGKMVPMTQKQQP